MHHAGVATPPGQNRVQGGEGGGGRHARAGEGSAFVATFLCLNLHQLLTDTKTIHF